jgi:dTMP kinase
MEGAAGPRCIGAGPMRVMTTGKFITFEGGEGAGKSTQARMLSQRLGKLQIEAVLTREPGGTQLAEAIRAILLDASIRQRTNLSEVLLFYAARADHLGSLILPALKDGKWVICDRFSDSTRAYQGAGGAIHRPTIESLENIVVGPCQPNLTIILDVDPQVGLKRAIRRSYGSVNSQNRLLNAEQLAFSFSPDRFEALDVDFHRKVREAFQQIAADDPNRCVVIDSSAGINRVAEQVFAAVVSRFGLNPLAPDAP